MAGRPQLELPHDLLFEVSHDQLVLGSVSGHASNDSIVSGGRGSRFPWEGRMGYGPGTTTASQEQDSTDGRPQLFRQPHLADRGPPPWPLPSPAVRAGHVADDRAAAVRLRARAYEGQGSRGAPEARRGQDSGRG